VTNTTKSTSFRRAILLGIYS